jgi:hypothetical protein
MAGRTKSRALAFPIDHPAILIAMPSSGGDGELPHAHEKSHAGVTPQSFRHDRLVTTAAVRFRRWLNNRPEPKWFHPGPTILRQQGFAAGDGIAEDRPLDWHAA